MPLKRETFTICRVTLDAKHNEKIDYFNNKYNSVNAKNNNLKTINDKLKLYEKKLNLDLTPEELEDKLLLQEEKKS